MGTLTVSQACLDFIASFEDCRLQAYRCPAGVLTIGIGHTTAAGVPVVKDGMTITREEAFVILRRDVSQFALAVKALVLPAKVTTIMGHEFDAMVSLAFNIGVVAFAKSTVLKRYLRGDKAGAADAFLMWNKVKGTVVRGLVRRRVAEAEMFRGDVAEARIAGVGFNAGLMPMPQAVDTPAPRKTMAQSTTGNASLLALGGTGIVAVREGVDLAQQAQDTASSITALLGTQSMSLGLGVLVMGLLVYIWFERRRRLHEDLA